MGLWRQAGNVGDVSELALKMIHLQPIPFFSHWRYTELPALQRDISIFRHRTLFWAALRLAGLCGSMMQK